MVKTSQSYLAKFIYVMQMILLSSERFFQYLDALKHKPKDEQRIYSHNDLYLLVGYMGFSITGISVHSDSRRQYYCVTHKRIRYQVF